MTEQQIENIQHGQPGECPTCSEPGIFNINSPKGTVMPLGTNWIWFNTGLDIWECGECWLK